MDAKMINQLENVLRYVFSYLKQQMIAELILQGHKATGQLIESIDNEITSSTELVKLDGTFVYYGRFVDTGRRAGGKKVPIDAIIEWIKVKQFESDIKKIKGMAFAIQQNIFKHGISQQSSWRGTTTGQFMTKVLENNKQQISDDVRKAVQTSLESAIFSIVNEINQRQINKSFT